MSPLSLNILNGKHGVGQHLYVLAMDVQHTRARFLFTHIFFFFLSPNYFYAQITYR